VINLDDDDDPTTLLLPMDHPLVQQLLSNSRIQAGLNNPRVVSALQSLSSNPNSIQRYLADEAVAPVLAAITQTIQSVGS